MSRTGRVWLAFAAGLAVVLSALAWVSVTALRLDSARRRADRQAAAEEKIRLALWRMDSALVPLIGRESAWPASAYAAFHPIGPAYTRLFRQLRQDEVVVPSPLLTSRFDDVLLHFQLDAAGELTSPEAPTGNFLDLASDGYVTGERLDVTAERLDRLKALLRREALLGMLPEPPPAQTTRPAAARAGEQDGRADHAQDEAVADLDQFRQMRTRTGASRAEVTQLLTDAEWVARNLAKRQAQTANTLRSLVAVEQGQLKPCWVGKELILARRVRTGRDVLIQGCWLNWDHLRRWLLTGVEDLLPAAELGGCESGADRAAPRVLASLPVRLLPGEVPEDVPPPASPVPLSLWIAWACVLLGAAAVAVLLGKAVSLSERRGAFVSAVTHELRTPLTTFRLYAEMLADGIVADERKRTDYLRRLRDEADRLSHLVENVLAYAKLTGRRPGEHLAAARIGEILDRSRDRLAALAERAEMQLVVEADGAALERCGLCNVSAVEQVLLNLVDNACKYAGRAEDRRIHLQAETRDGWAILRVRDHGPGIARRDRKRLFKPFRKSAREAAHSAPGIGLGLSLSRRLARDMGGDLQAEDAPAGGASFALTLPLDADDAQ